MSYNLVRLLHLFYLRLRLQLKNLLPGAFQTKILLLLGGTKYCIIFSYLQQFSFFRFSAREYIFGVFLTFFSLIMPFFLKKLSRIGDFSPKFAYPTPSYKMPKKAPIPHQILHCGTGDSLTVCIPYIKYRVAASYFLKSLRTVVWVLE